MAFVFTSLNDTSKSKFCFKYNLVELLITEKHLKNRYFYSSVYAPINCMWSYLEFATESNNNDPVQNRLLRWITQGDHLY